MSAILGRLLCECRLLPASGRAMAARRLLPCAGIWKWNVSPIKEFPGPNFCSSWRTSPISEFSSMHSAAFKQQKLALRNISHNIGRMNSLPRKGWELKMGGRRIQKRGFVSPKACSDPDASAKSEASPERHVVLNFLKEQGVDVDLISEVALPEDVDIMRERLEFLRILGLNPAELINEFPPLAGCSVSRNFIPVLDYLEGIPIGRASLPKLIQKYPRVLYFSVKIDLEPIIDYLQGMGILRKNLEKILVRYPQILGFRLEGTMSTSIAYLVSLGVDPRAVGDVITAQPEVLGMRVANNLKPKMDFLLSFGVGKQKLAQIIEKHPFVLQFSLEDQMQRSVEELLEIGVQREDVGEIICRYPDVLGLRIKERLTPVRAWLTKRFGFSVEEMPALILKLPQILVINKSKADQKIDFFLNYGFSGQQAGELIRNCPQLLGSNISETIRPRLEYLVQELGREFSEIADYPDSLLIALDKLQARFEEAGAVGNKASLKWLLDCSDDKFRERLEVEYGEGPRLSPDLLEGPVSISSRKGMHKFVKSGTRRQASSQQRTAVFR